MSSLLSIALVGTDSFPLERLASACLLQFIFVGIDNSGLHEKGEELICCEGNCGTYHNCSPLRVTLDDQLLDGFRGRSVEAVFVCIPEPAQT